MVLIYIIHRDSCIYELFDRQCFWFADSISAILEKWSGMYGSVPVTIAALSGCVKGIVLHRRKPEQVEEIWTRFTKQIDKMNNELRGYEDKRLKEVARMEELERHVEELNKQQERERQEREMETREQKEAERHLRTAQEERIQHLMQRIMDQRQQLEEKDREWEMFRERKNSRPQELVRRIGMASSSKIQFDPQSSRPQSHF
jgi:chromosome segregation ATPase